MYGYQKRESKIKSVLGIIILMAIVSAVNIYLYNIYLNINVKQELNGAKDEGKAIRLSTRKYSRTYYI